ncbi:MAG: DUF2829 domain-containing protein [Cyclobacteriaceae bacterium]
MDKSRELYNKIMNEEFFDGITTEQFLTAWIMVNGADDIYDCLISMLPEYKDKVYDLIVRDELKKLYVRLATSEVKSEGDIFITFGRGLELLKKGFKIARKGWNGKGMFIVYQKGYPEGIPSNKQTAEAWGINEGDLFIVQPYLQIKNVDGSHSMWVPSINDCLAEDWIIID